MVKIKFSKGNKTIGDDTLIFNMSSATDCASIKEGTCLVGHKGCYAMKAEKLYPNVLPYRRQQGIDWQNETAEQISEDIKTKIKHSKKYPKNQYKVRVNEAGDFISQDDVYKLCKVASLTPEVNFQCFTARRDLYFDFKRPDNLTIVGSSFMVDNYYECITWEDLRKKDSIKEYKICNNDCKFCSQCKSKNNFNIYVIQH